ncbi:unnamed protein product [Lathyrus sativus]|nr:unnamed protein product [Lathyrus sativus]
MDKIPSATAKSNKEKFCLRPSETQKIRFRVHHRGYFVDTPAKLYVVGLILEMNWKWNVDYLSYFELLELIKKDGYRDIMCIWYWNPRYSFTRGLRKIKGNGDVLRLIRDVDGCEVVDLYVEHSISVPDIVDDAEVGHDIISDDDDVQCTSEKFVDDEVEVDNNAEAVDDAEVGEVNNDVEVGDCDGVEVSIDVEVSDDDGVEVDIDAEVGDGGGVEVNINAEVGDGVDVDNDAEVGDGVDVHNDTEVGDGHDDNGPELDSEEELESELELD